MNILRAALIALICAGVIGLAGRHDVACRAADEQASDEIVPIHKTDAQWKRLLTAKQFEVTRRKETEPAFNNKYWHNKKQGAYRCVCCDLELFRSETKFESDTGWPSFYQPVDKKHVEVAEDRSDPAELRTEVLCARCAAHLGHVFNDGPQPTGLRYCMNSTALKFIETRKTAKSDAKPSHPSKSQESR